MKRLNKLQINSDKVMNVRELITLRGEYDVPCTTICYGDQGKICYGYLVCDSGNCDEDCQYAYGDPTAYGILSSC